MCPSAFKEDHLKEDLQIFDFSLADEEVLQLSDMSTSLAGLSLQMCAEFLRSSISRSRNWHVSKALQCSAGRLSAVADVAVPVGGAVGGALLISAVLDSLDAKSDAKPTGSAVKKATLPEPEKQQKKKKSEDEDEDEDDGAL